MVDLARDLPAHDLPLIATTTTDVSGFYSLTSGASAVSMIVRVVNGTWTAIRIMQEPLKALTQSYTRTKAKNLADGVFSNRTRSDLNRALQTAEGASQRQRLHHLRDSKAIEAGHNLERDLQAIIDQMKREAQLRD